MSFLVWVFVYTAVDVMNERGRGRLARQTPRANLPLPLGSA